MDYDTFLERKLVVAQAKGIKAKPFTVSLFDFQQVIVPWALDKGRAAIFAEVGLGKTAMQLEWAHQMLLHTVMPILIACPLAVGNDLGSCS